MTNANVRNARMAFADAVFIDNNVLSSEFLREWPGRKHGPIKRKIM